MRVGVVLRRNVAPKLYPAIILGATVYRRTAGRRLRVVAVVGSLGKSTTTRAIAAALDVPMHRPALLNANTPVGVGRALLSARPWHKHAAIEAAINGPGQMRQRAHMLRPDITVVTAIASDHWKSLGSLEQTRDEKAEMVRVLRPSGVAILNADDPNVRWMETQTAARVVLVGESPDAEVRATDVRLDWPRGMRFNAVFHDRTFPVATKLLGRHFVFPVLAALAVARLEDVPLERALKALENLEPTMSRMQPVPLDSGAVVIRDDYKAGIESFAVAMSTLAEIPAKRRIAVMGALSESHGRGDYREVGAMVGAVVDQVVLVGHNDDLKSYKSALVKAGVASESIQRVRTAHEAAQLLKSELRDGDVVLTKGRWQQALPRVALELAGRDVQCRADPCPFTRMMCDLCPYLERPFDGRGVSPLARRRWSPQASGREIP